MESDSSVFNSKLDVLVRNIPNYSFLFEVTKLCGYSEFMAVPKHGTLMDMYKYVSLQFGCNVLKLFVTVDNMNIDIPLNENILVKDFILQKRLSPIYKVPLTVVYRLYLDDGHFH